MRLELKDSQYYCYCDYLTWPDDVRYELIDGQAYVMSPTPDLVHQDVVEEIYLQTANSLKGKPCRAFVAPVDVRLPKHDEANEQVNTVVQPDVLVVCDGNKLDRLRGQSDAPRAWGNLARLNAGYSRLTPPDGFWRVTGMPYRRKWRGSRRR